LAPHLRIAVLVLALSGSCAFAQGASDDTQLSPGLPPPSAASSSSTGSGINGNGSSTDQEIESLYDKDDVKPQARKAPTNSQRANGAKEMQSLSDLATLAPFSDVAVIERRFLPKTNRFEFSGSVFANLNNPFFNSFGGGLRGAYYLTERYAVEGLVAFSATSSRQVTDDLLHNRSIRTDNVVTSRGYEILAFKWNPIYGKMTWLNKSIVPFDLNFDIGLGATQTSENQSEPTLHIGTSQVFAYSKSMAFRWDLTWNGYNAHAHDDSGNPTTLFQNDLFLGIGVSFYFPEATYR
jgi:outer membrane beta-barrel protein